MPAKLVEGQDAEDVAAYVAAVVAKPGKDTGLLADGRPEPPSSKPAVAKNGKLAIPADPGGQLLFTVVEGRRAPAGKLDDRHRRTSPASTTTSRSRARATTRPITKSGTSTFTATYAAGDVHLLSAQCPATARPA